MNDEAWEDASSIDLDYTDLLDGESITSDGGLAEWTLVETEVID